MGGCTRAGAPVRERGGRDLGEGGDAPTRARARTHTHTGEGGDAHAVLTRRVDIVREYIYIIQYTIYTIYIQYNIIYTYNIYIIPGREW